MKNHYIHKTAKKNNSFFSKMRKFMLVSIIIAFTSLHLSATVSGYKFYQANGTFTTVVGQQGAVSIAASAGDNNIYTNSGAGYPIGFTFNYNGTNFTTFCCVDDGYLQLGNSLNTDPLTPLSSLSNCIAAMGCNLYNVSGGRIDYLLSGTAPSRILTLQWTSMSMKTDGLAGHLNFQIQLFESSNMIQIVYGSCGTSSSTTYTPQSGMTGASTSDFNDRTHTTGWSNTTAGGANSSTITYNSTYTPGSGLTYCFSPYCLGGYSSDPCGVNTATGGFSVNGTTYQHGCNIGSLYPTITYIKNYIGLASVPTLNVSTGYTMTLFLPQGSNFMNSTWFYVWVDWNNSGSFTDNSNKFTSVKLTSGTSVTTTLSVPSTATDRGHLMLIRSENGTNSLYAYTTACNAYSEGTQDYYVVNTTGGNPMTYSSSTTGQLNNGNVFGPGSTSNQIIQVQVVTTGGDSPFNMTSMVCNTNGSTAPGADIANAKMYYTGTSSTFSSSNQFGSTMTSPNGSFTFSGSQVLSTGTNYFWLTYDITNTPDYGDTVDACCNSIVMSGTGGTQTPSVTCPAGNSTVNIIYCTPSSTNGSSQGDGISNIFLSGDAGGINTSPNVGNNTSYTNWAPATNTTVTVTQGSSYTLMMTSYTSASDYFGAWVDWSNSGSFTDNGNKIITNNSFPGAGNTQFLISFTVPAGATIGTHRLRTRCVNTTNPVDPCTVYGNGVANDFSITVINATPIVTSYNENSGCIGNGLTITGSNFNNATAVTFFNNISASDFTVVNNNTITVTIPTGATTGVISVTNPMGTGTGPVFTISGTSPVITTDGDQNAGTNDSTCTATVNYNATTNGGTFTYSFSGVTTGSGNGTGSGSIFNEGVTNVVLTASNGACSQTASFNVTVIDDVAPWIVTQASDTMVETDGAGNADDLYSWIVLNWGNADARDNCSDTTYLNLHWNNNYTGIIPGCGTSGTTGLVSFYTIDEAGNASPITSATFTIIDTVPPEITCPPTANISTDAGLCTSSASIGTATGFDVGSDVTITYSPSGPYTLGSNNIVWIATDACGNSSTCSQSVIVVDNIPPTISCIDTATRSGSCKYIVSGSEFDASASDNCGASGLTYSLSGATTGNGSTTLASVILNIGITTIIWTAIDAQGNTSSCSSMITVNPNPILLGAPIHFNQVNVTCNGLSNGIINVSPAGGMAPYTYSWTPSEGTNATISNLAVGIYTVTVTDAIGCTNTNTATIGQPSAISLGAPTHFNQVNVTGCYGNTNGIINVSPAGGTPGYTYSWTPNEGNNATISNLAAGSYSLTVTDANGCTKTNLATLGQPSAILLGAPSHFSQVNVTGCFGNTNGSISVNPSGGTPGYSYSWTPSEGTNATISNLGAGSYTVTVTDANHCTKTNATIIAQPSQISLVSPNYFTQSNITCFGLNNGIIRVNPYGGTPGYTYSWTPSEGTNATISNLPAGSYTVTVSDANHCSVTKSTIISQPTAISLVSPYYFNQTNITCNGANNGIIRVSPNGGTPGYNYVWSPNEGNHATISNLSPGAYSVTVSDANGCTKTNSTTIAQPTAISLVSPNYFTQSNVTCFGGNNGIINVNPTGGTPGYTYSWTPSEGTNATISNLPSGNYTVTVMDANHCTATKGTLIAQPTQILIGAPQHETQTNPTCSNGQNGIIRFNPVGGIQPYGYSWSPNVGTSATVSNLSAGTYNVTVTDANQCTRTNSIVLVCTSRIEETDKTITGCCDFKVYPNPAEGFVTIEFSSNIENVYSLKLIDIIGREIKTEIDNASIGENSHVMNLDGVAPGVYMILLQNGDNVSKSKIVIE